jgi:two-component system phosphate regulon response regulator PhoB
MIVGLECGADDYITKPFSPRVLSARVKALLRRRETQRKSELETTIEVHELSIHPGRHEVKLAGRLVELTYTEFALLQFLAKRPGWAYTRPQIVDAVKGEDYPVTERSVDVQVAGLRKKLGTYGSYIETVRGVGYRFRA